MPKRRIILITLVVFLVVLIVVSVFAGGESTDTGVVAAPTPTTEPSTAKPEPMPTASAMAVVLTELVVCERLRVDLSMLWGQSPAVIHSGDPRVTGRLEPGDYIRLLTTMPEDNGALRVQVYPHDYRAVGQTNDQVWIYVDNMIAQGLHEVVFTCEDA